MSGTAANRIDSRFYLALVGGTGWLVGIGLAAAFDLSLLYWFIIAIFALIAAVIYWHHGRFGLVLAGVAALALGSGRYLLAQPPDDPGQLSYYNGTRSLIITGRVIDEPQVRDTFIQLPIAATEIMIDGRSTPIDGRLLVQTGRYADLNYGATVRLNGDLDPPEALGSTGYAGYLKRQGILSVMVYPDIAVVTAEGGSPFYRALLAIKNHGRGVIGRSIAEPQASLLTGILLGDDSGMSRETAESFRVTGMTHI